MFKVPTLFASPLSSCVTRNYRSLLSLDFLYNWVQFLWIVKRIELEKEHGNVNAIINFQVQLLREKR